MLFIVIFLCFSSTALSQLGIASNFRKLNLPNSVGPETLTFDIMGRGPYTGVSDGRILRYDSRTDTFEDFSFTNPNRSKIVCDGSNNPDLRVSCGRPLGIEFYYLKNQLFITDASRGLFVVGRNGGLATQLLTEADQKPFVFLDALTVDQITGDVYLADFSTVFSLSDVERSIPTNDSSGRLLKYSSRTGQVTVLKRDLSGTSGVALSSDRSYLLVTEFLANRIQRFWLRGPRALTSEVVAIFEGPPDNIKRTLLGDFWVGLNIPRSSGAPVPTAIKINGNGDVLRTLSLEQYYPIDGISEFSEKGVKFYVGSLTAKYVGMFS